MDNKKILEINKTNAVIVAGVTYPPGTYEIMLEAIDE